MQATGVSRMVWLLNPGIANALPATGEAMDSVRSLSGWATRFAEITTISKEIVLELSIFIVLADENTTYEPKLTPDRPDCLLKSPIWHQKWTFRGISTPRYFGQFFSSSTLSMISDRCFFLYKKKQIVTQKLPCSLTGIKAGCHAIVMCSTIQFCRKKDLPRPKRWPQIFRITASWQNHNFSINDFVLSDGLLPHWCSLYCTTKKHNEHLGKSVKIWENLR